MTVPTTRPVDGRRQALRQQLHVQREQIARQLQPAPLASDGFPRSRTMRFLVGSQALPTGVVTGVARYLTGGRLAASVATAITVALAIRGRQAAKR